MQLGTLLPSINSLRLASIDPRAERHPMHLRSPKEAEPVHPNGAPGMDRVDYIAPSQPTGRLRGVTSPANAGWLAGWLAG